MTITPKEAQYLSTYYAWSDFMHMDTGDRRNADAARDAYRLAVKAYEQEQGETFIADPAKASVIHERKMGRVA